MSGDYREPYYDTGQTAVYLGDVRDVLRALPAESVNCVVTSPPYWSLRDYGIDPSIWGGDAECAHEWGAGQVVTVGNAPSATKSTLTTNNGRGPLPGNKYSSDNTSEVSTGQFCGRCNAWRGALGLEPTPALFVAHMVEVFREVRRVLRKDGTAFVNLGDSYFGGAQREGAYGRPGRERSDSQDRDCACRSLCDACRVAYQLGKAHSAGLPSPMQETSPSAPSRERMASEPGRLPTSDYDPREAQLGDATQDQPQTLGHVAGQPRASLASMPGESAQQPPDSHSVASSLAEGCLLCGRSLPHSARESERMAGCSCDSAAPAWAGRNQGKGVSVTAYQDYTTASLKPKDLVGIPWRVAFALQEDGWWLRQDIIWAKPNPMPESVTDRCTKAHEYVFLLSKSATYYYDADAIREKPLIEADGWPGSWKRAQQASIADQRTDGWVGDPANPNGRNKRSVWTVATAPFPEAHFATFPPDLVKPCILAGCPEGGTVLDPFFGSGTTGMVANSLGRKAIGIDLNPEYLEMARKRVSQLGMALTTEGDEA